MKNWYITGASTGLGRAYAEAALNRGDRVFAASIDPENMTDYADRFGEQAFAEYLDVTDPQMVARSFQSAIDRFGHIDVCVNNAGYMQCGAVEEMSDKEVRQLFDCNFFGTFYVSQQAAAHMRQRKSGIIVQTASLAAVDTVAGEGIYGASKHAVLGMSDALYHELKPFGVKVVVLEPGVIKTGMSKRAKLCQTVLSAYDEVLGAERTRWNPTNADTYENDPAQEGDPVKCAQALLQIVDSETPPRHIVFTTFANTILKLSTADRLSEAEQWAAVSASADAVSH